MAWQIFLRRGKGTQNFKKQVIKTQQMHHPSKVCREEGWWSDRFIWITDPRGRKQKTKKTKTREGRQCTGRVAGEILMWTLGESSGRVAAKGERRGLSGYQKAFQELIKRYEPTGTGCISQIKQEKNDWKPILCTKTAKHGRQRKAFKLPREKGQITLKERQDESPLLNSSNEHQRSVRWHALPSPVPGNTPFQAGKRTAGTQVWWTLLTIPSSCMFITLGARQSEKSVLNNWRRHILLQQNQKSDKASASARWWNKSKPSLND